MISKKVCMLGASTVGKTSLTRRFVHSIFSEEYHSTIGVKIDKKSIECSDNQVNLVIWDVQGEEKHRKVMSSYFKGMAGYLLIVDGSRPSTIVDATDLHERVTAAVGDVPYVLALNKSDLVNDWESVDQQSAQLQHNAIAVIKTSAKTGDSVEKAFGYLAEKLIAA